jgi:YgiT-type zinc finger domain-containing protein
MQETNLPVLDNIPCNECAGGVMIPRLITYFTWLGGELITVPDFPAWVCDVCGRREYDAKSISWLQMLLAPNAGKPTRKHKAVPPSRLRPPSPRQTSES